MENQAMENQAEEKRKYRILSLDGGGMRGIISAIILKEIEEIVEKEHGQKLHEYFDLVAGTSTGSIMAAGIACQMTARDLIDLYKKDGQDIFISRVRWQRSWRLLTRLIGSVALYPHERKNQGLANVLRKNLKYKDREKEPKISDSKITENIELLILAYDVLFRNTTWFASTPYNKDPWYADIQLWKICTASASAPTFFPPYKLDYYSEEHPGQNIPYIDGGVSANNPALSAIAHALWLNKDKEKGSQLKDMAVLSIGTGITTKPYRYEEIKKWGLLGWISNLADIFLNPSDENEEYICGKLFESTGGDYLRLAFQLNERLKGEKESKKLRPVLKEGEIYNKYIFKKYGEYKAISEEIDDPSICEDLEKAAESYIECGEVEFKENKKMPVLDAIKEFIESN